MKKVTITLLEFLAAIVLLYIIDRGLSLGFILGIIVYRLHILLEDFAYLEKQDQENEEDWLNDDNHLYESVGEIPSRESVELKYHNSLAEALLHADEKDIQPFVDFASGKTGEKLGKKLLEVLDNELPKEESSELRQYDMMFINTSEYQGIPNIQILDNGLPKEKESDIEQVAKTGHVYYHESRVEEEEEKELNKTIETGKIIYHSASGEAIAGLNKAIEEEFRKVNEASFQEVSEEERKSLTMAEELAQRKAEEERRKRPLGWKDYEV